MSVSEMLNESSTPLKYVVAPTENAADDLAVRVARSPDRAAFARKVGDAWHTVTWSQFADQVTALAVKLVEEGIRPSDRVAVMSSTRYEWVLCDFAIWTAGAVSVPIYETSSAEQVAWILADSGAVAAFVENDRCGALVEQADSPYVGRVWTIDGGGLDALEPVGDPASVRELDRRRQGMTADSPATIVYTSGTTGRPKGCVLSHANLLTQVRNTVLADGISDTVLTEESSILLFLPLAHILARVVQLAAVHNGALTAHTSDLANLGAELQSFRPTLMLAVPRVFEKFANTARRDATASGHARLFRLAEATAIDYSRAVESSHGPSRWLRARRRVFDRLVYPKLRAALGGRVGYAVSGGAPLSARLNHFLRGIGVTVLEGYGLTETTAGVTLNLPGARRIGTVGRPLPGSTVRIATDGEVEVKGPTIFGGYWHDSQATQEALTDDGWLRTGDLGELDDGYLTITGRKKDLIVTASGKNVAPEVLEDRLRTHWLVDQCVVVGDNRPYIAALITLDQGAFTDWKQERRVSAATVAELRHAPELRLVVQVAIDEANAAVSHAEAIKRFAIVATDFVVSEELTPTQKVRRNHVLAKFADEINDLYRDAS